MLTQEGLTNASLQLNLTSLAKAVRTWSPCRRRDRLAGPALPKITEDLSRGLFLKALANFTLVEEKDRPKPIRRTCRMVRMVKQTHGSRNPPLAEALNLW